MNLAIFAIVVRLLLPWYRFMRCKPCLHYGLEDQKCRNTPLLMLHSKILEHVGCILEVDLHSRSKGTQCV